MSLLSRKRLMQHNCRRLQNSDRTLSDIYDVVFDREDVLAESTDLRGRLVQHTAPDARETITRIAAALSRRCRDRFIALYCDNRFEWVLLFWGILKSGNKPYLVNMLQPDNFTRGVMSTLDVACVVGMTATDTFDRPFYTFDELAACADGLSDDVPFGDELALTTSGTSGGEKICLYTGREISAQVLNAESAVSETASLLAEYHGQLKMLQFLPLYHIYGLEAAYLWYAFWGTVMVFPQNLAPDTLLRTVRMHDVTHIFAVPLLWHTIERTVRRQLAERDETTVRRFERGTRLSLQLQNICPPLGRALAALLFREVRYELFGESIRFCISGGSYLKESALSLINAIGYPLYNGYGMTEVGIACAEFSQKPKHRISPSIGKPFSSFTFRVNEDGTLAIKGDAVCKRMKIDGKDVAVDEWFNTGDVVTCDARGHYTVSGRRADVIITENGENINPDLAERQFSLRHATAFAVLGDADDRHLQLIVQLPDRLSDAQRAELLEDIARCTAALPRAYRPQQVLYTRDPLTVGKEIKVSRHKLRRRIENGEMQLSDAIGETRAVQTDDSETKRILRDILAGVLGISPSDVTDNAHFVNDLGGTSLDYFAAVGEINERFGITMDFESNGFGYTLLDFERTVEGLTAV